ncbi:MAG: hypothetical protein MJZ18_11515 [Bacteroidales bacterium]|nr:hypothetical protein [Bacteroidales bacterium]
MTIIALLILCNGVSFSQINYSSKIQSYYSQNGSDVLMERDYKGYYSVIYYFDKYQGSIFLVKHQEPLLSSQLSCDQSMYFSIPKLIYSNCTEKYIKVLDIKICGHECYFCGVEHVSNHDTYLDTEGNIISLAQNSHGIIGRFNIDDVISGGGAYEIMDISETKEIKRLAVKDGYKEEKILAVGVSDQSQSCLVEIIPFLDSVSNTVGYDYSVIHPYSPGDEYFEDVVYTGSEFGQSGSFVTLSSNGRYGAERGVYFTLRYGIPANFVATAVGQYDYRIHSTPLGHQFCTYRSTAPFRICATHRNNEVVVSYLLNPPSSGLGTPMLFKIFDQGDNYYETQYISEGTEYVEIMDMKSSSSWRDKAHVSLLLKDVTGNSVVFTPSWMNTISSSVTNDTYLTSLLYKDINAQAISTTETGTNQYETALAGPFWNNSQGTLGYAAQKNMIYNSLFHGDFHCFDSRTETVSRNLIFEDPQLLSRILYYYPTKQLNTYCIKEGTFQTIQFISQSVEYEYTCSHE